MRHLVKDFRDQFPSSKIFKIANAETHDVIVCYRDDGGLELNCISNCAAFGVAKNIVTCWGRPIGRLLKDELRQAVEDV
jgi:hypothetical protein